MLSILSYTSATFLMYSMAKYNENKKYQTYTGWSRLQILFCIPFYTNPKVCDLIFLNSFGCFISVHMFYCLSNYEILHTLASRSLSPYDFYIQSKHKKMLHFMADFILHGSPCLFSLCLKNEPYPYKEYVWLLPAITHVTYPYLLTKSFDPSPLYNITGYSNYQIGWFLTIFGYGLTSYVRSY